MKVFDSSALLALIFDEAGAAKVEALLAGDDNVVGAANFSEVLAKLADQGMSDADAEAVLEALAVRVEPLTAVQALAAGRLRLSATISASAASAAPGESLPRSKYRRK